MNGQTGMLEEFRGVIRAKLSDAFGPKTFFEADFDERLEADRVLADRGLLGYHWPEEFGGAGGDVHQTAILDEELARIGLPAALSPSRFGINLLGPALIAHGTEEQKKRFLPAILGVQEIWCQGFSEPEAGSDLASVATVGAPSPDGGLVITGSKTWTTQAHRADLCFALVRTGEPDERYRNLSMVLIPLNGTGVTIQPIKQSDGQSEFNSLFFDETPVPGTNLLGSSGAGWSVAQTMLNHERSYGQTARYLHYLRELEETTASLGESSMSAQDAGEAALALADIADRVRAVKALSTLVVDSAASGEESGVLPSIVKLWWSTTHQDLMDVRFRIALHQRADAARIGDAWLRSRAETIYAGATEIQLNIIAERKWGLPRV